jgi:choline-sulfatase
MDKKHIVFLLSDQHNPNILGYAGDPYVKTPHLDKLAENGVVFDNCYCPSPLCVPSRSSMMAALLPSNTGVYNNFQCLRSDKVTFAHCLSAAGYETVLSGRMHFIGPDQRHGFEKHLVGDITPTFPGIPIDAFHDALAAADFPGRAPIEKAGPGHSNVFEFDKAVNSGAMDYLKNRKDPRPLFMTVGYFGPHCPFVCSKELYDYYYKTLPEPEEVTDEFRRSVHPAIRKFWQNRQIEDITREQTRKVRAAYYGMVEYFDSLVGTFLAELDRTLGLDNTIVVYASDHGENLGYNGVFWKSNYYEGSVRVPMVFSCPGLFPQKQRVKSPVSLMDIGPTLIDYAEGPELPKTDGASLLAALNGLKEVDPDRAVFSQLVDVKGDNPSIMVRKREWKFVIHEGYDLPQLFNVEADPEEKNDLGSDPRHAVVRKELAADAAGHWNGPEMIRQFEEDRKHDRIMRKWVVNSKQVNLEHWQGEKKNNYLLEE